MAGGLLEPKALNMFEAKRLKAQTASSFLMIRPSITPPMDASLFFAHTADAQFPDGVEQWLIEPKHCSWTRDEVEVYREITDLADNQTTLEQMQASSAIARQRLAGQLTNKTGKQKAQLEQRIYTDTKTEKRDADFQSAYQTLVSKLNALQLDRQTSNETFYIMLLGYAQRYKIKSKPRRCGKKLQQTDEFKIRKLEKGCGGASAVSREYNSVAHGNTVYRTIRARKKYPLQQVSTPMTLAVRPPPYPEVPPMPSPLNQPSLWGPALADIPAHQRERKRKHESHIAWRRSNRE